MKKYFFNLFVAVLFSCNVIHSKDSEKQKEEFSKGKIGMKRNHVIQILGHPNNIQIDSNDNKKEYYLYSPDSKFEFQNETPTAVFDSTGTVEFSTYGDGD